MVGGGTAMETRLPVSREGGIGTTIISAAEIGAGKSVAISVDLQFLSEMCKI